MRIGRLSPCLFCVALLSAQARDEAYDPFRQEMAAPDGFRRFAISGPGPFTFYTHMISLAERDLRPSEAQADAGHAWVDIVLDDVTVPAVERQGVRITADPHNYADRYWGNFDFRTLEDVLTGNAYFYIVETKGRSTPEETRLRLIALDRNGAVTVDEFSAGDELATPFRAQFFRVLASPDEYRAHREACFTEILTDQPTRACSRLGSDLSTLAESGAAIEPGQLERVVDIGWYENKIGSEDATVRLAGMQVLALSYAALSTAQALPVVVSGLRDADVRVREMAVAALRTRSFETREELDRGLEDALLAVIRNDPGPPAVSAAEILASKLARPAELRDACLARLADDPGEAAGAGFVRILGAINPPDARVDAALWELAQREPSALSVAAAQVLVERESPRPELSREILRLVSSNAHFCAPSLVKSLPALGAPAKSTLPELRALRDELLVELAKDRFERTRQIDNDGFTLDMLDHAITALEEL